MDTRYDWGRYLIEVAGTTERKIISAAAGVAESTASRWINSKVRPTNAGHVAAFAQHYGRSPLEAFVAAGLLDLADATRALDLDARRMLKRVEMSEVGGIVSNDQRRHAAYEGGIEGSGDNDI